MIPYLVALNIETKPCLVVGGGNVATRKIEALLDSGAYVTVISPNMSAKLDEYANQTRLTVIAEGYRTSYLQKLSPVLVIAATDKPEINRQVVHDAQLRGIWVNDVTTPHVSDFHNVATINHDPIYIGISTSGASPALMRYLKKEIAQIVDDAISILALWLGELRSQVANTLDTQQDRQALYRTIVDSDVLPLLRGGDIEIARQRFDALVQEHVS